MPINEIFLLGAAFILKHFIVEYVYQRPFNWLNKGKYGHPGGLLHTANHAFLSAIILLFEVDLLMLLGLIVFEAIIRYHTDWLKIRIVEQTGATHIAKAPEWWVLTGVQQTIFHITYLAMLWIVAVDYMP